MNTSVLLVIIAFILVIVLSYLFFFAPKSNHTTTTQNTTTTINITSNSTNQSTSNSTHNPTTNYTASNHSWEPSQAYPYTVGSPNCVVSDNSLYCIGGSLNVNYTSDSYYSFLNHTNGGIEWYETIPIAVIPSSCLPYLNEIFCITGNLISNHNETNETFYASTNASGLSTWNRIINYPANATTRGCATYGYVIYCVGGFADNGMYIDSSYYATISRKGITQWTNTTAFPIAAEPQCYVYLSTIYCVGSYYNSSDILSSFNFYAPVSAGGIASWKSTTVPPNPPGTFSCSFYDRFEYCHGGEFNATNSSLFYYTGLSIGGINGWHNSTLYPLPFSNATSCATYGNTTYCVGGTLINDTFANNTYYTRSLLV